MREKGLQRLPECRRYVSDASVILKADGSEMDKDYDEAMRLYKIACDGGNMIGCTNVGLLYADEKSDPKESLKYLKLACDKGDASGCYYLGSAYINGEIIEKKLKRGV